MPLNLPDAGSCATCALAAFATIPPSYRLPDPIRCVLHQTHMDRSQVCCRFRARETVEARR